jgi:AmmeMemoRadiSam system protein A/AmmeMemoRadiSam system protein B
MAEFTQRVIASGAEIVVLISPHAPLNPDSFVAYDGPQLSGDFADFRAPETTVQADLDDELLNAITGAAQKESYRVVRLRKRQLDHGIAVPLYFLQRNGWPGSVVALGYSFLTIDDHLRFGACIRLTAETVGRPVAIVASGDLSHRLKPEAPAGYHANAHLFDEAVVDALKANVPQRIIRLDPELRKIAGECGYRSMLVAIGATQGLPESCEVLSYEAPFGVGYLVAQLTNQETGAPLENNHSTAHPQPAEDSDSFPELARRAIETFVLTGSPIKVQHPAGLLAERAACFVSIRTDDGDLRGCIGTIEPTRETLAEELIANAVLAATSDPRFKRVTKEELSRLHYSVDVLSAAEPTTFAELDPAIYGVIVEDESDRRRGLLLPDIEGVDTATQQVEIASRKAGIPPGVPVRLLRFRVQRFGEQEMSDASC